MRIKVFPAGTGTRIELAGAIQVRSARELHAAAIEASQGPGAVTVDWSQAERLDASAFQILAALDQALRAQGRKLEFTPPNPSLRSWLAISGFAERFQGAGPA